MNKTLSIFFFFFLAAVWGASFLFMRVGVPEFGAYAFAGLRLEIAALVTLPLLLRSKRLRELKAHWLLLSVIGIISAGLPFLLYAFAAKALNAGIASVINASVPMITGLIAHTIFKDYLSKQQFIGLAIGILGVALLVFDNLSSENSALLSFAMAIAACVCYGIGGNLAKRYLTHVSAITIAATGFSASGLILLPFVIATFPTAPISWQAWGTVIAIAVMSTAIALIMYYTLLKSLGPTKTSTTTLVVPIFGIFWGMLFLNETLTINTVIGTLVILSGTALTIFNKKKPIPNINEQIN